MDLLMQAHAKLKNVSTLTNCEHYKLPLITFISEENAGKSSLIESLIGCSFIPRQTSYPIEIEILKKDRNDTADWAVIINQPDCLITDFEKLKEAIEINNQKKLEVGNGAEAVQLRVHSSKLSNLCLVDLPGIKKLHDGNYDKSLILKYISDIRSIIVIVIAADEELNSNEAMKLAKQVDPERIRTLLVLTKLDLLEHSEVAKHLSVSSRLNEIFYEKIKQLPLQVIGVVNKMETKNECIFLKKNYPKVAHMHGIPQLIQSLYQLILNYLKEDMPKLKDKINVSFRMHKQILASYGEPAEDHYRTMLELVAKFTTAYSSTILGPYKEVETEELTGGARINYIFTEIFGKTIRKINPLSGFDRPMLLTAIKNATGIKSTIFIPDKCFELIVKQQIRKLEGPSLRCVQLVYEELEKIIYNCGSSISSQLNRYPELRQRIVSTVLELIKRRISLTNDMVKELINIHTAYINTGHPDFITQNIQFNNDSRTYELRRMRNNCNVQEVVAYQGGDNRPNRYEEHMTNECIVIERFIISYFNIVRTTIEDCIPKTIMHFLVNFTMENLQSELVAKLFNNGVVDMQLMTESPEIVEEKIRITKILKNHEEALQIISDIHETIR